MAIYRLIRESVFEPEAIERMTTAYEQTSRRLRCFSSRIGMIR